LGYIVIRDNSASNCVLVGREVGDGGVETAGWGVTPILGGGETTFINVF